MAKGNMLLGYARGSVGDVTFSRLGGQQITKARVRKPQNPKSFGQRLQRMAFNTVLNAMSAMRPIVDHSWQGVQYGASGNQEFQRRNVALLRGQLAEALRNGTLAELGQFNIKGCKFLLPNSYAMSAGSLTSVKWVGTTVGVDLSLSGVFLSNMANYSVDRVIQSEQEYVNALEEIGVKPGDQLTFCFVRSYDDDAPYVEYESSAGIYARNQEHAFEFYRLVFRPWDSNFIGAKFLIRSFVDGKFRFWFNPIFVDPSVTYEGFYDMHNSDTYFTSETTGSVATMSLVFLSANSFKVHGACVIRSQRADSGWLRSTESMWVNRDVNASAAVVQESYGDSASIADSPWYLNQALNSSTSSNVPAVTTLRVVTSEWVHSDVSGAADYYLTFNGGDDIELYVSMNYGNPEAPYTFSSSVDGLTIRRDDTDYSAGDVAILIPAAALRVADTATLSVTWNSVSLTFTIRRQS